MSEEFENLAYVYEKFPFLEVFPFDEYSMRIEEEKSFEHNGELDSKNKLLYSYSDSMKFEPPSMVHFTYQCDNSDVTISFYIDDINFLNDRSKNIIKLDSIRKTIDHGLNDSDVISKMKAIKNLNGFMKKIGTEDVLKKDAFKSVLKSIQSMNGMKMPKKISTKLINLDEKLDVSGLRVDEEKCITLYLDFQLHHAKILLGTIIASKIY